MTNKSFKFKNFEVFHDRTAMKVGVDGVLLGAWAKCANAKHMLDIGTGSGLIALMMAQRNSKAIIEAIEIEKNAAEQATENFENSQWKERLKVTNVSLQKFTSTTPFDFIVCNPPYFENSLKAGNTERSTARHADTLSFDDIFKYGENLLTDKGSFSFIIPVTEEKRMKEAALNHGFYAAEICYVHTIENKPAKRSLISFDRHSERPVIASLSIKNERDEFTLEYMKLTGDFYLNFGS